MLYLIHGTDFLKTRKKAQELVASLLAKKPNAVSVRLDEQSFSVARLEEALGAQGLFENKFVVYMDAIMADQEAGETIMERLSEIAASPNVFIFLEGKLTKPVLAKFEKHAQKVQQYVEEKDGKKFAMGEAGNLNTKEFNIFALTDAFGARDKKRLWVLYQKACERGIPVEEMHGLLFWQLKSMLLASGAVRAEETDLNPFVFKKSRTYAGNFKEGELETLSSRLVTLYHDSRRGRHELDVAFERFILNI